MNPHLWCQRLLGRATCRLGQGARLAHSARIRNARGESEMIRVGAGSIIKGELLLFGHGGEIDIGTDCFVGEGSRVWSATRIKIGDRALISHNVNIFDSLTHPLSPSARHAQFRAIATSGHPRTLALGERPVLIGDDVLIGTGAIILRGVTIGRGAVVAAGAVLASDVEPFTVVGGNPARPLRVLSEDERQ